MALRYTVLAFLPVAYIHDLARSRFLVLALNLHGNNKGQPIDSTAQYERRDANEKQCACVCIPWYHTTIISLDILGHPCAVQ